MSIGELTCNISLTPEKLQISDRPHCSVSETYWGVISIAGLEMPDKVPRTAMLTFASLTKVRHRSGVARDEPITATCGDRQVNNKAQNTIRLKIAI